MPYPRLLLSVKYKHSKKPLPLPYIDSAQSAIHVIRKIQNTEQVLWIEELLILCCNSSNKLHSWSLISIGGLNFTTADKRVISTIAALSGCTNFILAHNHPTGSLTPSVADIKVTKQIAKIFDFMGYTLVDHIIYTHDNYLSMKDMGYIK